ncbi:MAG: M15 family metallopeptidase, partial [Pseudomonadota bacterium]|nr:M15 family metallopeptidase [Pseudomonadota bacterium]
MLTDVNLRCNLKYVAWELPGALPNAWLEEECLSRLNRANQAILEKTAGQAELLVWDALRDFETQEHLFNVEIEKATRTHPELNSEAVYEKVCSYVRPPSREIPPPHTTGGAVDVTLWVNGSDALLGKFDDFSAAGRSDYYDHYDPKTPHEARQKEYRKILAESMSAAGFSGIPEEWWHWEFGTRHWANANGKEVLYDEVQLPPKKPGVVHGLPVGPRKFMIDVHGIAQAFSSPEERAAALNGENAAHYYARTRHHNEQQLVSTLKGIVGAPAGVCFPTGLSAALASVCATTPM